ncbi:hypothetical protein ACFWW7_38310, partial [Streptomyces sp. NPDC059071]
MRDPWDTSQDATDAPGAASSEHEPAARRRAMSGEGPAPYGSGGTTDPAPVREPGARPPDGRG